MYYYSTLKVYYVIKLVSIVLLYLDIEFLVQLLWAVVWK